MSNRYRVHVFPVIHIPLEEIEADSPQQAIDQVLARTDVYAACQQAGHEFNEDVVCYLVDEITAGECRASQWFQDRHHTSACLGELLSTLEADGANPAFPDEPFPASMLGNFGQQLTSERAEPCQA